MKTRLLLLILALCSASCQDNAFLPSQELIQTRAVVDKNNISISNPELITNWENLTEITLNTVGTSTINKRVSTPWTNSSTPLSEKFRKDIKAEDGWIMLFHTFKEVGLDEKQNYMCLYNQFTGFIKIFYYYEGDRNSQGTQWFVRTSNGEKAKLFNLTDYIAKTDTAKCDHNIVLYSNLSGDPTKGLVTGWNGFEFEVPYCTDYRNIDFVIGAYDKNITSYDFLGKGESSIVGTTTGTSNNTSSSTTTTSTATVDGEDAKKYIDNLNQKAELGSKIDSLITSVPNGGHASAITSGANKAFGRTTTTTTTTSSSSTTKEDIKLTTTGTISMIGNGSSETTSGIPSLSFNLYNAMNPSVNSQASTCSSFIFNSNRTSDAEEHFLGVWTVKTQPWILYERFTPVKTERITKIPGGEIVISGNTRTPKIVSISGFAYTNPDIIKYKVSATADIELMRCDTLNGIPYKKGIKDIGADITKDKLLYKDISNCFYDTNSTKTIKCSGSINESKNEIYRYYYDWGINLNGRILAIVSLKATYSYHEKIITVNQSRIFEVSYNFDAIYVEDYDAWYNNYNAGCAVINYRKPAYGILIEEEDLYLYGK